MADLLLKAPYKYEPKLTNRWVLRFPTDVGIQDWQLKSCKAPSMTLSTKEMKFINTSSFVNGSYKWNEMAIVVRDFIAPSTSQGLIEWLRLHAESVTGRMGYNVGSAKSLQLEILDPTGVSISRWLVENAILTGTIDWGNFTYDSDEVAEISFSIQPSKCILLF
jgi:hypothetical protein